MKRFIKRPDLTSLWEEDGDLKRVKAFFHTMSGESDLDQNEQIKQRIKQKALEKMAIKEEPKELPKIVTLGLIQRTRHRLRRLLGHRPWKLVLSVVVLAFFVIIGQGMMNGSFNFLPGMRSAEKSNQSLSIAQQPASSKSTDATQSQTGGAPNESMSAADSATPQAPSSQGTTNSSVKSASPTLPIPPNAAVVPPVDAGMARKITRNLSLTLQVATINDAVTRLSKEVQQLGGYVVESQQNGSANQSSAQMTLKVPADQLDGLRSSLTTWGKILDEHMLANDITNQYYDSQVRLQTLEAEEKRYLAILSQAKTVDDVLKVENALGNIRQQIEQLKGQLKLWDNIVDYSTVTVQLVTLQSPDFNIKNPWQPISWSHTWKATQDAVLKTISSAWNALNYLVVGIGYALPYLLLGALGWGCFRAWRKWKAH